MSERLSTGSQNAQAGQREAYAWVRCLFCETGKEASVLEAITACGWGRGIFAVRVRDVIRNKQWVTTELPLLPGYIFLYTLRGEEGKDTGVDRGKFPKLIRVLHYEDGSDKLMGSDLDFADWLWRMDGRIDILQAVREGDRVEITDGALKAMHGKVLRMNRRQQKVLVELETRSIAMQVWLSYEVIGKEGRCAPRLKNEAS